MTTSSTNRLDQIVTRQRQGHTRDIAFAVMIAVFLILSVFALRDAGAMRLSSASQWAAPGASSVEHVAHRGADALCAPAVC